MNVQHTREKLDRIDAMIENERGCLLAIRERQFRIDERIRRLKLGLPSPVDELKESYVKGRIGLAAFERRVEAWL